MSDDLKERLNKHTLPFLRNLLTPSHRFKPTKDVPLTFQTFDDEKPGGKPRGELARIFQGSLTEHAAELDRLNQAGAGIFVTVNGTDGKGRKKSNIASLRAWWTDLDDKDAREPLDLARLPLKPSMRIRSGHGGHLYWIAAEPFPCAGDEARCEAHESELKRIHGVLEPFGADHTVCEVARVMRLPGFYNRKREPHELVELVEEGGPCYQQEDIQQAFPALELKAPARKENAAPPRVYAPDRAAVLERAGRYLDTLPEAIQGQNGSGATFNAALKIMDGYDLAEDEALDLLMERFNPRCVPAWSLEELQRKVRDAAPVCRERGHLLREAGPINGKPRPSRKTSRPVVAPEASECGQAVALMDPPAQEPAAEDLPEPPELPPAPDDEDTPAPPPPPPPEVEDPTRPMVKGFEWKKGGLYKVGRTQVSPAGDEIPPAPPTWIAPHFTLPGLAADDASNCWRLLIAWRDMDGISHEEAVPFELLSGEGGELGKTLAQGGMILPPEPGLRRHLLRYLCGASFKIRARVRLVDALGWHKGAFVMPNGETIGKPAEAVRFAGELPGGRCQTTLGTLEGWQEGVARFAVGNPRLTFALACAFAGPILGMVRPDGGGGFNLMGNSSGGKSTCLEVAASVWGCPAPLPTWRATGNGLEGQAAARNDGFLVLDELSQVDPKEAGSIAYMISNGSAKARANREGGARAMKQWRLIFLSSGEQGLEDKMMEDGKRARAGQEVRVPDIPCPAEGMFVDAHGLPSLGALAEHLKSQVRKNYGHAARAFLENLCKEWGRREGMRAQLMEMSSTWLASAVPAGADAQVRRVGGRFALVAVAGELAQSMGILPWPKGEASKAAKVCFKAWLDRRGFTGASEVHKGIEAVLTFLESNGQSRFDTWGDKDAHVIKRAGTKKRSEGPVDGWDFLIIASAWKEACTGFSSAGVAKACFDAGILEAGHGGKHTQSLRVPGQGAGRYYVIRAAALSEYREREGA